ncbi:MAG: putative rane-bound protein [Mycobacterium sp.]|nr:putative rane-bound protein [Mycobacterium sp.]
MTTPPTPAGWYPDPDGSGGPRYWDGSQWTEHRFPAAPEPTEPTEPPVPAEPPASEQPTTVVPLRPAGEHVGAHRAPESEPEPVEPEPEPVAPPGPEPEPTAIIRTFEPAPAPSAEPAPAAPPGPEPGPTAVIPTFEPVPVPPAEPEPEPTPGPEPEPTAVINLGSSGPSAQPTTPMASPPPPSGASAPLEPPPPGEPPAPDDRRKLLIWFGSACAALLAVLVLVIIYGLFLHKDPGLRVSTSPGSMSESATPTTATKSKTSTESTSESPTTASGSGAQASDGGLTFAITGTETAASVKYQDAPVVKNAQGEFIVVHMTVLNSGDAQGTFLATLQKLNAGGTTYSIDDEATAYLNGTWADLTPGGTADLAIAFDVPPGTTPESLEVHGAPMSTGVEVPLS